mgnify:CR=1 FL=1
MNQETSNLLFIEGTHSGAKYFDIKSGKRDVGLVWLSAGVPCFSPSYRERGDDFDGSDFTIADVLAIAEKLKDLAEVAP